MKKNILLTAIGTLLGAASLQATDIYITGSSAFKASAFNAISNLYSSVPAIKGVAGDSRFTMSGQMSSLFGSRTIVVHANFNGSVQGIHGLYDSTDKSVFFANTSDATLVTNSVTCAFTDVDSSSTAYPLDPSSFTERYVAVQPFVYVRSVNAPITITNVNIQQLQHVMPNGRAKLFYLTGDTNNTAYCYLANRSLDSGTRVTAYMDGMVSGSPKIYTWWTNGSAGWFQTNVYFGPTLYGYGYVGGGDIKNVFNINNVSNIAIGYLGLNDAKGVNAGQNILSYNGFYPSTDIKTGSVVPSAPLFDSVRNGQYSFWAYEVFAWRNTVSAGDQNISATDLDAFSRKLAGYDSSDNFVGGLGSIDYDIANTPTKIAVRIGDMNVSRSSVGGMIAP